MSGPARTVPQSDPLAQPGDEAHLVMFSPVVMLAGQSMYVVSSLAIYWFFKDAVPPSDMRIWLWIAGLGLGMSVLFCAAFAIRRPGPVETLRVWRQIDKRLTHVFDVIAVAAILLLFPHGDEKHRLVALAFCVGYGPMQLVVDPENLWANRISVVAILGTFGLQLWLSGSPAALILSVLFVLYGGMLIVAAGIFRNAVADTVQRKRDSELAGQRLAKALSEVSASRDAKTRFIASASHDLGQPLQAASLFARHLAAGPDAAAFAGLDKALGMARNMVAHMLHYLRLESDSVTPSAVIVDVARVVRNTVQLRSGEAREHGIALRVVPGAHHIVSDPALLQRALDNLLGNSITHSQSRKILVGCKKMGSKLRIYVIDCGIGIAEGEHNTLFADYAQGTNAAVGGFGLGLSSARRIAILLGGQAAFDTRWRQGCAVFVELPLV